MNLAPAAFYVELLTAATSRCITAFWRVVRAGILLALCRENVNPGAAWRKSSVTLTSLRYRIRPVAAPSPLPTALVSRSRGRRSNNCHFESLNPSVANSNVPDFERASWLLPKPRSLFQDLLHFPKARTRPTQIRRPDSMVSSKSLRPPKHPVGVADFSGGPGTIAR